MPLLTKEQTLVSPVVIKITDALAKPAAKSKKEVIRKDARKNNTKVLISIKNFDNETIDNLISNQISTDNFIKQVTNLINKYDLNGVNIDFEYVTDSEFPTSKYFVGFMEELSLWLKKENPKNIISIDVNALAVVKDKAYNMTKISKAVDQVILMAYDFRQPNSTRAGPTAPINGDSNEHSITESLDALSDRVPNEKLILAIPFYGYEWQTQNADFKSETTAGSGSLATIKRVKELLDNRKDIKVNWDMLSKSPWISFTENGVNKQIYYEDDKSIAEKIKFIKEKNLGGVGIWALGYEGNNWPLEML